MGESMALEGRGATGSTHFGRPGVDGTRAPVVGEDLESFEGLPSKRGTAPEEGQHRAADLHATRALLTTSPELRMDWAAWRGARPATKRALVRLAGSRVAASMSTEKNV